MWSRTPSSHIYIISLQNKDVVLIFGSLELGPYFLFLAGLSSINMALTVMILQLLCSAHITLARSFKNFPLSHSAHVHCHLSLLAALSRPHQNSFIVTGIDIFLVSTFCLQKDVYSALFLISG